MKAGHYTQACPKLEQAEGLYRSPGILLNLADCYEHINRLESAWTTFGQAATAAANVGRADDQAEAKRRQSLIEPRLSRINLHVAKLAPGLVLALDGNSVAHDAWNTAIPVDPGAHSISASAPGFVPWSTSAMVQGAAQTTTIEVPDLKPEQPAVAKAEAGAVVAAPLPSAATSPPNAPAEVAPPPVQRVPAISAASAPSAAPNAGHTQRVWAIVAGGTGAIGLGLGGVLGLIAKSRYDAAQSEGVGRHNDSVGAVSLGNVATGVVIAGAVLCMGGIVLWFTAPTSRHRIGFDGRQVLIREMF